MINLVNSTTDKLQLTTDASCDVDVHASWADLLSGDVTPGRTNTTITTATTTDIVATPASSTTRNVKTLNIRNAHASTSVGITVIYDNNGTDYELFKTTLLAGDVLSYVEGTGWFQYTPGPSAATQAQQEAGTATNVFVAPATQHYHPSAAKCWVEAQANSTTILASYNITSLTDTATGTMTVTIATDFSSVNWCCVASRAEDDLTLVYSCTYNAKTAGAVALNSVVEAGGGSDPTSSSGNASWSMVGMGDH